MLALSLAVLASSWTLIAAQPCDPSSQSCPDAIPGLEDSYSIDFRQQTSITGDWVLADDANVTFSNSMGANFSFVKRYDAPYIWTKNYFLFGRVDVEVQAAPGTGLITGCVLMSDNKDEFDWEWSGNNFNQGKGLVQTNYFGKGITGNYDRGTQQPVDNPQGQFHTYSFDWSQDKCDWLIDDQVIRTLKNDGSTSGDYQFPQTPSRVHLGIWNAGDADTPAGVQAWAGGLLDMSKVPYSAYVKSIKITPYMPCSSWQYPGNFTGKWQDVKCTNETVTNQTISQGNTYSDLNSTSDSIQTAAIGNSSGSSTTSASATAVSPAATQYIVKAGDTCNIIAQNMGCSVDDIQNANPGANCNMLIAGANLNIPVTSGRSSGAATSNGAFIFPRPSVAGSSSGSTVTNTIAVTAGVCSGSNYVCSPTATVTVTAAGTFAADNTLTVTFTAPCDSTNSPAIDLAAGAPGLSTQTPGSTPVAADSLRSPVPASSSPSSGSSSSTVTSASSSNVESVTTSSTDSQRSVATYTSTPSPSTDSSIIIDVSKITTMLMITITQPCTMCNTYSSNGQFLSTCSNTVNTTITTTQVTTTVLAASSSSTSPSSSTPLAAGSSSSEATAGTSSSLSTSSSPTTPPVTIVVVPCRTCMGGMTTVTSTCSTYTALTTVTVPCNLCSGGSTTITSISTMTYNYTTGPPTTAPYANASTPAASTVNAANASCAYPSTSCSTMMIATTACSSGQSTNCPALTSYSTTCAPTICTTPSSTPTGGVTTSASSCTSLMTTCSTYVTSTTSCSSGQSTDCATTPVTISTCNPTICTSPYTLTGGNSSTTPVSSCTAPGTTCSTLMVPTTSCSSDQPINCASVTTTSTTCASTICYTPPATTTSGVTTTRACAFPGTTCSTEISTTTSCNSGQRTGCSTGPLTFTTCDSTICYTPPVTSSTSSSGGGSGSSGSSSSSSSSSSTSSTSFTSSASSTSNTSSTSGTSSPPVTSAPLTSTPTLQTPTGGISSVPPTCTPDACFNEMFCDRNIDKAHNDAKGFCSDRNAAFPSWLDATRCSNNRARVTSAFQCITASATPVPDQDDKQANRACYQFGNRKIYGQPGGRGQHRKGRREEGMEGMGQENKNGQGMGPNNGLGGKGKGSQAGGKPQGGGWFGW